VSAAGPAGVADGGEVDVDGAVALGGVADDTATPGAATMSAGPFADAHAELDGLDGVAIAERITVLENVNRLIADELADLDGL
jgi:hypothetical protein